MHDPAAVAAYVAGELTGAEHDDFERHLLSCEQCWSEVERGRRGRQLARLAEERAPEGLRERIAAEIAAAEPAGDTPSRRLLVAAGVAVAGIVLAVSGVLFAVRGGTPEPVAAAIADFRADRLPGARIPDTVAPDLTKLGLSQTAAGAGDLDGVPVTAYAYQDRTGRRLLVYVGTRAFTTPADAQRYEGAWVTEAHGVSVLCSREPHVTLVVGADREQVKDAAEYLNLT